MNRPQTHIIGYLPASAVKATALLRQKMPEQGPESGGAPKGNQNAAKAPDTQNNIHNVHVVSAPHGNSETYLLRRLKRDREDLAEKVVNGELSAHAAAVEAGFRVRMVQHPATVDGFRRAIERHLSPEQQAELYALRPGMKLDQ